MRIYIFLSFLFWAGFVPGQNFESGEIVYTSTEISTSISNHCITGNSQADTAQIMENAKLLWEADLETSIAASPLVQNDKIYIASRDGFIYCFSINGKQLWQYNTNGTIISQPVVADDILAAATLEGEITILKSNTGKIIQAIGIGEPITSQISLFRYEGDRDVIIDNDESNSSFTFGTESGILYSYDLSSLGYLWESDAAATMIQSAPICLNNKIFFMNKEGSIFSVDAKTGKLLWMWTDNKNFSSDSINYKPVCDGKNIYISDSNNNIFAVDLLLGKPNWSKDIFKENLTVSLSLDSTLLYIKSKANKFYIAQAKDGKLVEEIDLAYQLDSSSCMPIEIGGKIVLGSNNGVIFYIDKTFNQRPVLFTGTSGIVSIEHIKEKLICAVNAVGKVFVFEMN